ncbi:MAG: metallophosphoesterase family protein [Paludibacteraceae bacterium]
MKSILSSLNRSEVGSKKLMVISDIHIMSEKLLKKDGTAFQNYLQKDRKLLQESRAIAESLVDSILKEQPDLVLVCGDMTKDGELLSHQKFVETFNPVIKNGIKMLVIPGNHDINNPDAIYFNGDKTEPAKSVSPEEFHEIYNDFGFGNAVDRDINSLSYVSEPVDGLWVIAIDGCRYYENQFVCQGDKKNLCVTEGKIKSETMRWIKRQANLAQKSGKQIIVMIHHNVVEHFDFQGEISAPYLLENFKQVQSDFMQAGIQVVFTGHFHANDIAKTQDVNGNYLFDVETGSPVTYPCPYRVIEFRNNQLLISTRFIEKIDYDLKGVEFQAYAKKLIKDNIPSVLSSLIKEFYPEIKQAANPYLPFIKLPEAQKLGQIVEDNLVIR